MELCRAKVMLVDKMTDLEIVQGAQAKAIMGVLECGLNDLDK